MDRVELINDKKEKKNAVEDSYTHNIYSEFMKIDSHNYVLPIKESSESISDDREFN